MIKFDLEDFNDAKIEWLAPDLTHAQYRARRAAEYSATHATDLSTDAVDQLVEADVDSLDNLHIHNTTEGTNMTNETNVTSTVVPITTEGLDAAAAAEQAKKDARNAKRRAARAAAKTAAAPAKAVTKSTSTKTVAAKTDGAPSKKDRSVTIYKEVMKAKGARKDGIARLTEELGLSTAGASTYWQNCKSGAWS